MYIVLLPATALLAQGRTDTYCLLLAASAIPVKYHKVVESPLAPEQAGADVTFEPETRTWKTTMCPTQLPTTRDEVIHLTAVLDVLLSEVDDVRLAGGIEPMKPEEVPEDESRKWQSMALRRYVWLALTVL